jgi:hypothetical protein
VLYVVWVWGRFDWSACLAISGPLLLRDCSKEILYIVALGGVLAAGFGDLSNTHFYKDFQLAA